MTADLALESKDTSRAFAEVTKRMKSPLTELGILTRDRLSLAFHFKDEEPRLPVNVVLPLAAQLVRGSFEPRQSDSVTYTIINTAEDPQCPPGWL